jgi:hypothetical protein
MLGCFKIQGCNLPVWIMYGKSDVMWMMHGQNKYQIPNTMSFGQLMLLGYV